MKHRLRRGLAVLGTAVVAAGSLIACSQENGSDAPGSEADSTKSAVVLEYGAADTLNSLGLSDAIAGMSTMKGKTPEPLTDLQEKLDDGSITDLGSLKEPKLDEIAQLSPDAIYYGARTRKMSGELEKLADNVVNTQAVAEDGKTFFESNRENVEKIASDFGKEDEAQKKLDEIDELVQDTKSKAESEGTAIILMTTGGKISAYGPDSGWYGFIYNDLGFTPAGEIPMEDHHGTTLSWEQIAEMNPDHVFVFDRDAAIGKEGESAEKILDNEIFNSTKAAKEGNVHYLEPTNWYLVGGGLDAMKTMVQEVNDALT